MKESQPETGLRAGQEAQRLQRSHGGGDGVGGGGEMEIQKGGVIGLHMADSCFHTAEANKTL